MIYVGRVYSESLEGSLQRIEERGGRIVSVALERGQSLEYPALYTIVYHHGERIIPDAYAVATKRIPVEGTIEARSERVYRDPLLWGVSEMR